MTDESLPTYSYDSEHLQHRFEVVVPGSVSAIPKVVTEIMTVVREVDCARDKEFEIEVVLNEALANAVVHGCQEDPKKVVRVSVECAPGFGVIIVVKDPGNGFDPATIPDPVVGEQLFSSHGRGIFLINRLMDEVRIEENGTRLWMRLGPEGS